MVLQISLGKRQRQNTGGERLHRELCCPKNASLKEAKATALGSYFFSSDIQQYNN